MSKHLLDWVLSKIRVSLPCGHQDTLDRISEDTIAFYTTGLDVRGETSTGADFCVAGIRGKKYIYIQKNILPRNLREMNQKPIFVIPDRFRLLSSGFSKGMYLKYFKK